MVAEHLARIFEVEIAASAPKSEAGGPKLQNQAAGPRWFFRDGDRHYWNGSSHSQDEGWQCSVVEFYLRTRFPQWKVSSGRGGPTDVSAAAYGPTIDKLKLTVVFCEFGYYGRDDQVDGIVKAAEKLAALCQDKKVRLVMMPSAFRAVHINRLPAEYKGLNPEQIAALNARKQQDGTLAQLGQELPVEIHKTYWRMRGAPGCDKRVAAMQAWGEKVGVFVPRTYQDQRDWLLQVWEKAPKFPWGIRHAPVVGYVAVGYFLLERMDAPIIDNRLVLDVGGDRLEVFFLFPDIGWLGHGDLRNQDGRDGAGPGHAGRTSGRCQSERSLSLLRGQGSPCPGCGCGSPAATRTCDKGRDTPLTTAESVGQIA